MQPNIRHYLESFHRRRRYTLPIVLVAVMLAFGVSLVVSALTTSVGIGARASLLLGFALILTGFACVAFWLRPVSALDVTICGVLPMNPEHQVQRIEGYELSRRLQRYFNAILVEDKDTARVWREAEIAGVIAGRRQGDSLHTCLRAKALVREALEYFVLEKLCEHLGQYYIPEWHSKNEPTIDLQREEAAEIRRSNRFLELFSMPLDMRKEFIEDGTAAKKHVRYAISANGALFEHFRLRLPRRSVMRRVGPTGLLIDTLRFKLIVRAEFDGSCTTFPDEFERLYLGRRDFEEVIPYDVRLRVCIEYRWWSFLAVTGWNHYEWLDSFLDKLVDDCAFEAFLSTIGWRNALTTAIATRNLTQRRPRAIDPA